MKILSIIFVILSLNALEEEEVEKLKALDKYLY